MHNTGEFRGAKLDCCVNGFRRALSFGEVHDLLWTGILGWVILTDWLRAGREPQSAKGRAGKLLQEPVVRFAYLLLTNGSLALTLEDRRLIDAHGDSPTKGTFTAWACRFRHVFPGIDPIEHLKVMGRGGNRRVHAYRMRPGLTWLIVMGTADDSQVPPDAVDWALLEVPSADISLID